MKKVIIPTLRFPPAGGVGLHRIIKMGKKLAEQGVEVHYITTENNAQVNSYTKDVDHPNIIIKKIPSLSLNNYLVRYKEGFFSKAVSKLIYYLTYPLFFVDYATLWGIVLIPYMYIYMNKHKIDNIYVSGPAFSTLFHMAILKRYFFRRMNLICEWRDYWTDDYERQYLPPRCINRNIQKMMENFVIKNADRIVAVSPTLLRSLVGKKYMTKGHLIENGFDRDDFAFSQKVENIAKKTICYTGNIVDTRAEGLFLFLDYLKQNKRDDICFELCGELGYKIKKKIESQYADLIDKKKFIHHGLVSVREAIALIERSNYGLVLVQRQHPEALTSKFFEYCCGEKPIIAIGPKGDLQEKINAFKLGIYCELDNFNNYELDEFIKDEIKENNFKQIIEENDFYNLSIKLKELIL